MHTICLFENSRRYLSGRMREARPVWLAAFNLYQYLSVESLYRAMFIEANKWSLKWSLTDLCLPGVRGD